MATSGSHDFKLTRNDAIQEALEVIGEYSPGETPDPADIKSCSRTLNMMIKSWQTVGIGLWKNEEYALFLGENDYKYSLGPTGDHATGSYVKTEIATAASSGDSEIVVDSITGISDADIIGVELDGGDLQWTTVNGDPADSTITLTAVLTDDVAVDNHVYTYTTIMQRPMEIIEARLHRSDDSEIPMDLISRDEYMAFTNKASTGTPNQIYFDPQLTNAEVRIWQACNNVQEWIMFTARIPIQDMDSVSNDFEFPPEWSLAIVYNLAVMIAPKFRAKLDKLTLATALGSYQALYNFDRENASVFISVEA